MVLLMDGSENALMRRREELFGEELADQLFVRATHFETLHDLVQRTSAGSGKLVMWLEWGLGGYLPGGEGAGVASCVVANVAVGIDGGLADEGD